MSEIILTTDIKREKGKLYFCGTDDNGFITIGEAVMSRKGRPKKEKKKEA